ncbi:MAG: DUF5696 domain-containing protein [Phycisphaerae bacterium]
MAAWKTVVAACIFAALGAGSVFGQTPKPTGHVTEQAAREEWGGMPVRVSIGEGEKAHQITIAGKKQRVVVDADTLGIEVESAAGRWRMMPSKDDLTVRVGGKEATVSLADSRKDILRSDPGYRTGVQIRLFDIQGAKDLTVYLWIGLEGKDEDLVFDVVPGETCETAIRAMNWPGAVNPEDFDTTILSNVRGVMLPKNWPTAYDPIREQLADGSYKYPKETTEIQSDIIEDWSMSWWGFEEGKNAMMCIVETPDDAAYQFKHPAGGPTIMGPRWRESLGRMRYERSCRFCFLPGEDYNGMAKRYREYVKNTGLYVSLAEKIARNPKVKDLIGTPITRSGILTDIVPDSLRYKKENPKFNHHLNTFDERAAQYRKFKEQELERLQVVLTGWPHHGYDRQHPDELPPAPAAGGWEGMKRLADACHEIGYLFALHDQYRDYYTDAPSFSEHWAVHEEDENPVSVGFPGSRFGQWKEGTIPYMNNWDGGKQSYINNRTMPGEIAKTYTALKDHGIQVDGTYLDVFGYVPVDEDFNPEHPTSRTDALNAHRHAYTWARNNVGFIGTEAGCDWTVPYTDYTSPLPSPMSPGKGIAIPLFNLVYHDAVMTPYAPNDLHGLLNGGVPQISLPARNGEGGGNPTQAGTFSPEYLKAVKRMAKLHERVALCEMVKHEFLSDDRKIERTTFSDGTTVTVDWNKKEATISPDVE